MCSGSSSPGSSTTGSSKIGSSTASGSMQGIVGTREWRPRAMPNEIDFEAEGLLKGTRGRARPARRELLAELASEGVSLEELRQAVAEDRLALLPVERELAGGDARYTANQIAELSGIDPGLLDRDQRALGMALAQSDEIAYTEADLEAARRVAALRSAGVPEEEIVEMARVLGIAMSQVAAATRSMVGGAFAQRGDTERDLALRLRDVARGLTPMLGESLAYILNLHLREQLRHDAINAEQVAAGSVAAAAEMTVCFADLVGFTRLGEQLPAEELGTLSRRLWALAGEVTQAPTRLV